MDDIELVKLLISGAPIDQKIKQVEYLRDNIVVKFFRLASENTEKIIEIHKNDDKLKTLLYLLPTVFSIVGIDINRVFNYLQYLDQFKYFNWEGFLYHSNLPPLEKLGIENLRKILLKVSSWDATTLINEYKYVDIPEFLKFGPKVAEFLNPKYFSDYISKYSSSDKKCAQLLTNKYVNDYPHILERCLRSYLRIKMRLRLDNEITVPDDFVRSLDREQIINLVDKELDSKTAQFFNIIFNPLVADERLALLTFDNPQLYKRYQHRLSLAKKYYYKQPTIINKIAAIANFNISEELDRKKIFDILYAVLNRNDIKYDIKYRIYCFLNDYFTKAPVELENEYSDLDNNL